MTDSQSPDRRWLYSAVLARSLATGMMGVLLGIYLASLDLNVRRVDDCQTPTRQAARRNIVQRGECIVGRGLVVLVV